MSTPNNLVQAKCTLHQIVDGNQSELLQVFYHTMHHSTVVRYSSCICFAVLLLRVFFPAKPAPRPSLSTLAQRQFLPCFAKFQEQSACLQRPTPKTTGPLLNRTDLKQRKSRLMRTQNADKQCSVPAPSPSLSLSLSRSLSLASRSIRGL